jgi:Zn finger protein HypA/HybF involved in hydrogenase expression
MEDMEFIRICLESDTMAQAAAKLGLHFNTFKRKAIKLDCYKTNQAGKGIKKKDNGNKISLIEILEGKHPYYQTNKLRKRLISEGYKTGECEVCEITEWNGQPITIELDHIDGNRNNHSLENLKMLCPNCHSQTSTFRGKKR